jgi:hypothetical protein
MKRMLDDRLDRRKLRAACNEHHRLVRVLAPIERAEWPFEAQDLAPLALREQRVRENPSGNVPDMPALGWSSCGGVVSEKLRRFPSFNRKSTYWPATYCSRSLAGNLKPMAG